MKFMKLIYSAKPLFSLLAIGLMLMPASALAAKKKAPDNKQLILELIEKLSFDPSIAQVRMFRREVSSLLKQVPFRERKDFAETPVRGTTLKEIASDDPIAAGELKALAIKLKRPPLTEADLKNIEEAIAESKALGRRTSKESQTSNTQKAKRGSKSNSSDVGPASSAATVDSGQ